MKPLECIERIEHLSDSQCRRHLESLWIAAEMALDTPGVREGEEVVFPLSEGHYRLLEGECNALTEATRFRERS